MTKEMCQAVRLSRQLAADGATPVEIAETVDEALDRLEPELRAFREAFTQHGLRTLEVML